MTKSEMATYFTRNMERWEIKDFHYRLKLNYYYEVKKVYDDFKKTDESTECQRIAYKSLRHGL